MRNLVRTTGLPLLLLGWGIFAAASLAACKPAHAVDWLTMASTYTHDPASGARVSQYAPAPAPQANQVSNFRTSGYTNFRSSLNFGPSADNYHRVETWGDPVRPYGEWRFPFRPFSTPYPNWGPPFGGLNLGVGGGFAPGFGRGFAPGAGFGPGIQNGGQGLDGRDPSFQRQRRGFQQGFRGGFQGGTFQPYPIGPRSVHPDPPFFDGHHPTYRD